MSATGRCSLAICMAERKRRDNGQGTISQRADGSWCGAVRLPDGRRKWVYAQSREAVVKRVTTLNTELARGQNVDQTRETVGRYLDRWFRDIASPRLAPNTQRRYALDVRRIRTHLGSVRLTALTPRHVQEMIDVLSTAGMAPRSIRHCRAVLRVALHDAEGDGLIGPTTVNAAKRVRTPRVAQTRPEAIPMTQARAFIAALHGDPLEPLVTTAIGTGLRQGELLGLRWADVDLDAAILHVRNQLQRHDGVYQLRAPKTADSQAPVPLPAFVVERLRAHRAAQNAERLRAGTAWIDQDLVFCTPRGTPLNGPSTTHTFQKRLVAAGVQPVRFHDLRHAAASLLFAAGASMKEVQVILRHSRLSTTADIYTAVAAELGHDAMRQLDRDYRQTDG